MTCVYLFGAGAGAKALLKKLPPENKVCGIIDNDHERQGTEFSGVTILSLEQALKQPFDSILITTQWVHDVVEQLLEYGVPADKIDVPPKHMLRNSLPFTFPENLALARKLISYLCVDAMASDQYLVVDFGTLLGILREGDIISWDDDVDFSIRAADAETFSLWLVTSLRRCELPGEWSLRVQYDGDNRMVSILLKIILDKGIPPFTVSFACRETIDGESIHLSSLGMWFAPATHFEATAVRYECFWGSVLVPADADAYLRFVYGNWRTPCEQMKTTDYAHVRVRTFVDFKQARLHLKELAHSTEL